MFKNVVKNQKTQINKSMFGKRLAASLISACMVLGGFSAFAVEVDGETETPAIQNPAVVEKEDWSATLKGQYAGNFASGAYSSSVEDTYSTITSVPDGDETTVDEITIKENKYSGQWLAETFSMLSTNNNGIESIKKSHKVSVSFDMKTSSDNSNGNIIFFESGSSGRIGNLAVAANKLTFTESENTSIKFEYSLTPGEWVNVKLVFYPQQESEDINRCEWYVNDKLVFAASGGANASNFNTSTRVLGRVGVLGAKGLTYKNMSISGFKKETVEADTLAKKEVELSSVTDGKKSGVLDPKATLDETNGYLKTSTSGQIMTVADNALYYGADKKPMYDKYSFSYDLMVKNTSTNQDDNQPIAALHYLDNEVHTTTNANNSTSSDRGYMGNINVYGNHLHFANDGQWGWGTDASVYHIDREKWYNVEYVVEPATKKFTWYVNGEKVIDGTGENNNHWCASNNYLLSIFRVIYSQSNDLCFDNFKLSGIKNAVKPTENFAATSLESTANGLKLTFNKDVDTAQNLFKYIKVTDRFGNAVAATATIDSESNKAINLAIENANSPWYKVSVPERFLSAEGFAIGTKTVLSTPHFEVGNSAIAVIDGTAVLDATYTNTTNEEVNAIVILAAYNQNGILAQVSLANRDVAATNGNVKEQDQTDKVQVTVPQNGTVKAFVLDRTSYQPLCGMIEQAK